MWKRFIVLEINNKNIILSSPIRQQEEHPQPKSPSFRGGIDTVLNKSGAAMNWIENGGFLVLFLIQDFLGMTVPRTFAGFLRDREVTGEYNIQEGFEVLGREGLTGPCMMAVAPLSLWAASKFAGQSTSINTELIKHYGDSLKGMLSASDFDKALLKQPDLFKEKFYRNNIENILKNAGAAESEIGESVDYILKQLKNYENIPKDVDTKKFMAKSKYKSQCLENITKHINNIKYNSSEDLDMLQKVKIGSDELKNAKVFDTKKAFDGMVKYSNDAISFNKNLDKLDSLAAETLKHRALGKRLLMNVAMISATLGMLSVLPKLYIRGNTSPGARTKQLLKENAANDNQNNENVSFKGKEKGLIEKLGKAVEKNKSDFVSSELEYNGHNFTNTLMAGLSVFGLLTPRCMRAYSRAEVKEDGKKDLTELWEIIVRDLTSSLAVVFAVPMLTRMFVTSYEKGSGFVLMQKDRTKNGLKTTIDLLNPYSKTHVFSNAEITALYDNINSKEKMVNFCKYIDKNGGDLQKILSKADGIKEVFNENTMTLESLKKADKSATNKEILSFVENIETHAKKLGKSVDKKSIDEMITKMMKGAAKGGNGKVTAIARGLISVPGLLTTVFVSPYILGWCIPRLTYKNTRRIHAKEEQELQKQSKTCINA